jgi:fructose/tagatose bisphosphate aldolase
MVFVADDLGAWLVAVLAEAGRRRLAALVLGSEQERALRQVATSAVQLTAQELRPDDRTQADGLALIIGQVFGERPASPTAGQVTLLEELQEQVAGQLAVLDDAD